MLDERRIYCMDAVDFLKELPDQSVDLIYTDPPYNVSHKNNISRTHKSGRDGTITYDYGDWDYVYDPLPFLVEAKRVLVDSGSIIIWTSEQLYGVYRAWAEQHAIAKGVIVWEKTNPVPNFRKVSYRQTTELMIWIAKSKFGKNNPNFIFTTQGAMRNIKKAPICAGNERIKRPDTGKSHPNQKPLSICKQIIATHCRVGGLVVDPYCGVGSIPVAAAQLNRRYIGNDFDEIYAEMARGRLK